MFYQVRVHEDDTDCLRFLWWPNSDESQEPETYRMLVHVFGAASSPTCANVALQRTAEDNRDTFPKDVCDSIARNFYVDDFLKSVPSVGQATALAQDITTLCSEGGFHLTKWTSNNREVIESIPMEERGKDLKKIQLEYDSLPMERALGVIWLVEADHLCFKVNVKDLPPTRRNLLSIVSSIFDPLGLVSPFILKAKFIMQDLCRKELSWDKEINGEELKMWSLWLSELSHIDQLKISRCFKPSDFGEVTQCQVHLFSDASDKGYGVTSYVRFQNAQGNVHCALLLSKARVNPLKKTTIPRLELTAATVAVRLSKVIERELDYQVDCIYFWTDSQSVLKYLYNVSTRFHTFVANRVSLIREASQLNQ